MLANFFFAVFSQPQRIPNMRGTSRGQGRGGRGGRGGTPRQGHPEVVSYWARGVSPAAAPSIEPRVTRSSKTGIKDTQSNRKS